MLSREIRRGTWEIYGEMYSELLHLGGREVERGDAVGV